MSKSPREQYADYLRYQVVVPDETDSGECWEVVDRHDCSNGEPAVVATFSDSYVDAGGWAAEFADLRNLENQRGRGGFEERTAAPAVDSPKIRRSISMEIG